MKKNLKGILTELAIYTFSVKIGLDVKSCILNCCRRQKC